MEDICDGVKILCERMDTHPDDFGYNGKFYEYGREIDEMIVRPEKTQHRLTFFTQAERDMLATAYKNFVRNYYTRCVIETLVDAPDEPEKPRPKRGGPISTATLRKEIQEDLNKAFEKEYDTYSDTLKYKAVGRYAFDEELPDPWKK